MKLFEIFNDDDYNDDYTMKPTTYLKRKFGIDDAAANSCIGFAQGKMSFNDVPLMARMALYKVFSRDTQPEMIRQRLAQMIASV